MTASPSLLQVSPSDAELVRRVRQGDLDAYGPLMTRYRLRFGRYAYHLLGNESDAEEALQDAFTLAYRSLDRCRHPERFAAWLFRILVNRCRTTGARRGREQARRGPALAAHGLRGHHPPREAKRHDEIGPGL